jgi:hypothetical protein
LHTAGGAQVGFGLAARKKAPIIINVESLRSTLLERVQEAGVRKKSSVVTSLVTSMSCFGKMIGFIYRISYR